MENLNKQREQENEEQGYISPLNKQFDTPNSHLVFKGEIEYKEWNTKQQEQKKENARAYENYHFWGVVRNIGIGIVLIVVFFLGVRYVAGTMARKVNVAQQHHQQEIDNADSALRGN